MTPIIYIMVVTGIFACAASQIILKKSATGKHKSSIASMLNWRVLLAYGILFCSMLVNIMAFNSGMQMKEMVALESTSYIFVPLLSCALLKEHITRREMLAIALVIAGIIVFYL